uniref:Transposase n=1 Tax=Streptomyces sp. NBC_00003 TaxID=2903608 RepID=A0AAU2UYX8_9ACTN
METASPLPTPGPDKHAVCPSGRRSTTWHAASSHRGTPVTRVKFAERHCTPSPLREHCTTSLTGRGLTLRPRAEHEILQQIRPGQQTEEWYERYHQRAGVEGAIGQAAHAFEMRRSRYRGLAKTHLHHLLTTAAINMVRIDAWLSGKPLAPTRVTPFAALCPAG